MVSKKKHKRAGFLLGNCTIKFSTGPEQPIFPRLTCWKPYCHQSMGPKTFFLWQIITISVSGAILYYAGLADEVIVQWPQLHEKYPRTKLVEDLPSSKDEWFVFTTVSYLFIYILLLLIFLKLFIFTGNILAIITSLCTYSPPVPSTSRLVNCLLAVL